MIGFLFGGKVHPLVLRCKAATLNTTVSRLQVVFQRALAAAAVMATVAGCSTISLPSAGEDFHKGVYLGGGVVVSQLEPDTTEVSGVSVNDSSSSGVGLYLGYDLHSRVAIEARVADLGSTKLSPDGSISYQVAEFSAIVHGLNDAERRRQRKGFSAFARLGLGTLKNDAVRVRIKSANEAHLLAGLGVEYGFDNALAARAEYVVHEADASYVLGSVLYRFGKRGQANKSSTVTVPAQTSNSPDINKPTKAFEAEPFPEDPADTDGDGVANAVDACSGTPTGLPVNATGCEIFDGAVEGISFISGSANLTDGALSVLSEIAQALKDYPQIKVTIEAHTDNVGEANQNMQLSRRRALAVVRYLVDQEISGSRLVPRAFGDTQPRESNATAEGRAANRRVEFSVQANSR